VTDPVYDYICSIGELIDKLSIENIKCHYANNEVLRIREHPLVDRDHRRIAELEGVARAAGEQRVRLRDEINRRLAEAIVRRGFQSVSEARTYNTEAK
jgi:hypothetical protein